MTKLRNFEEFLNEQFVPADTTETLALIEEAIQMLNANESNEELNEGWKDVVLTGLISLMTMGGISAQTWPTITKHVDLGTHHGEKKTELVGKMNFKLDDKMTKEKADSIVAGLIKQGWSLDSTKIDTLWKEVVTKSPETSVEAYSLTFKDATYFASGKFDLTKEMQADIDHACDSIVSSGGTIVKVEIKSSTDKQPVSPKLAATLKGMKLSGDNFGLSKARSMGIEDYLVKKGFNDSIISVENLAEKGDKEIDQSARYVVVNLIFITPTKKETEETKTQKADVDYAVYLNKTVISKPDKTLPPSIRIVKCGKAGQYKTPAVIHCPLKF